METKLLINKNYVLKRLGRLASAAKCNNSNNNARVTCIITSEKDRKRKRSDWPSQSEQHHHHHHRPFVSLRPRSRLYCPPYLHRFPASSVISGIQLANTAYIGYKNQQTTNQTLSLACTPWPSTTKPTWNLILTLTSFSLYAYLDSNIVTLFTVIQNLECFCACGVSTLIKYNVTCLSK